MLISIIFFCITILLLVSYISYQLIFNKTYINTHTTAISNFFKALDVNDKTQSDDTDTSSVNPFILTDKIAYTIPDGWVNVTETDDSVPIRTFQSPDYKPDELGTGTSNGIQLTILLSSNSGDHALTLDQEKASLLQEADVSDISDTKIDGIPSIQYHSDWDGSVHHLEFVTMKNDLLLVLIIDTKNLSAEQNYQAQINEIISSIHFK